MEGCEVVFNSMGMPEQWVKDEGIFDQVNAIGSQQVAQELLGAGLQMATHQIVGKEAGQFLESGKSPAEEFLRFSPFLSGH